MYVVRLCLIENVSASNPLSWRRVVLFRPKKVNVKHHNITQAMEPGLFFELGRLLHKVDEANVDNSGSIESSNRWIRVLEVWAG